VLVDGDDMNEPVADTVRGILDGHVVLSRKLAHAGQFPAIDVLASVSRVMPEVTRPAHQAMARRFRQLLATYKEAEDLINIGAYSQGSNALIDEALTKMPAMKRFLSQRVDEVTDMEEACAALAAICGEA
jgi:flagellum-specific ATP synthase